MTIANTIRLVSIARDMSGHGATGFMSDFEHAWIEPGESYGLAFDGFTVYGVRSLADDGDDCYAISLLDMGDVEALRDEAAEAGDFVTTDCCIEALDGDNDELLRCVATILDTMAESLAD